jgi:aryl carrier-like protein
LCTHNLLTALMAGAVLVPHAPREDGLGTIPALLRQERITITNSSATLFRALAQALRPADVFPDVRIVRVGSERVRRSDVELARAHFPNASFVNLYSSTETSSERLPAAAATDDVAGTELERDVMALWREVLGTTHAGMTDDFLTIGGDSLRAGRLFARVFDRWGVDISFAEFLDHPTIAGLARTIEERTTSHGS